MKENFLKAVASELKLVRIEHGDLQEELAAKSGVAPSTISRYEIGVKNMNIDKIQQILKAYDMNLYVFFDRIIAKTQD